MTVKRFLANRRRCPTGPDSRLRGNDESIHTETCTASFPRTYIPSFPRKWESRISKASANL
ncbi:TPA: hypothetical protein ACFK6Y_07090 [Neisseria gonorrhoeae]|nr:hypothetical protein A6J43_12610 [Neisseria gonorrhoeae]AZG28830.1 hypothetical protein EGH13_11630 [Neisseria gonorrhoeae]OOD29255.1 hypothetical protein BWP02_12110 [Neisseria gonorrhoeae]OZV73618.1 hypothetical protein CA773_07240 [Neisseria gonorrhoeae]QIH16223.1 hypothetical protein F0T11_11455 [Neisseria gonorrhoeae]